MIASLGMTSAACTSSTLIQSRPAGARVFLDGEPVGVTPYLMADTKIIGATTVVKLEYPGYEPFSAAIQRNEEFQVGPCIAGVFLLVPFLWVMGYRGTHTYEMRPLAGYPPPPGQQQGDPWTQPPGAQQWEQPAQPLQPPPQQQPVR